MPASTGYVQGVPRLLLRAEGAAILVVSVFGYAHLGHSWWLFFVLILAPDLSMSGYLVNAGIGAACYNAVHSLIVPLVLAVLGLMFSNALLLSIALIWTSHIGFDRVLGYGLKYGSGFTQTHLGLLDKQQVKSTN